MGLNDWVGFFQECREITVGAKAADIVRRRLHMQGWFDLFGFTSHVIVRLWNIVQNTKLSVVVTKKKNSCLLARHCAQCLTHIISILLELLLLLYFVNKLKYFVHGHKSRLLWSGVEFRCFNSRAVRVLHFFVHCLSSLL
jgi:hypothetical protein